MNLLYPRLSRDHLPMMAAISLLGGLSGGVYGALHDWLTYAISSEYFSLMKFDQFARFDLGLPPHVFAAEIGFIAAGAVGLAAGWFIARIAVPAWLARVALVKAMRAFLLMLLCAAASAAIGNFIALKTSLATWLWQDLCGSLGVSDASAFQRVALIHTAGYVGALAGLVLAVRWLRRA